MPTVKSHRWRTSWTDHLFITGLTHRDKPTNTTHSHAQSPIRKQMRLPQPSYCVEPRTFYIWPGVNTDKILARTYNFSLLRWDFLLGVNCKDEDSILNNYRFIFLVHLFLIVSANPREFLLPHCAKALLFTCFNLDTHSQWLLISVPPSSPPPLLFFSC